MTTYANDTKQSTSFSNDTNVGSTVLLDSYSESNFSTSLNFGNSWFGQTIINPTAVRLSSCKFYLKKNGSPTGNAVAELYGRSGGTPTGIPLATSDNLDVSTLTTSPSLVTFTFSATNRILISANTNYAIILKFINGDGSNFVLIGVDSTSPTHVGSAVISTDGIAWVLSPGNGTIFYIYGTTADIYAKDTENTSRFGNDYKNTPGTLIDSYGESNVDGNTALNTSSFLAVGQAFTSTGGTLNKAIFYVRRFGTPTGTMEARLYALTGLLGSTAVPTGSPLATSGNVDVSILTTNYQLIPFVFNDKYLMAAQNYGIVLVFTPTSSNASNRVEVGDDSTQNHNGNEFVSSNLSAWTPAAAYDTSFYVYVVYDPFTEDTKNSTAYSLDSETP